MGAIKKWLQGKKTYIISVLMTISGLVQMLTGDMSVTQFLMSPDVMVLLNGIGLGTIRASIGGK